MADTPTEMSPVASAGEGGKTVAVPRAVTPPTTDDEDIPASARPRPLQARKRWHRRHPLLLNVVILMLLVFLTWVWCGVIGFGNGGERRPGPDDGDATGGLWERFQHSARSVFHPHERRVIRTPSGQILPEMLDESVSQNVTIQSEVSGTEFPLLKRVPLRQCLANKRILFIGHSHIAKMANDICQGLRLFCDHNVIVRSHDYDFVLRKLYDGTVFGAEQVEARYYRSLIENPHPIVNTTAYQYDIIVFTRSMWDLVFYDTHPKSLEEGTLDALRTVVRWLKPGGKLIFHPLHEYRQPSWIRLRPCAADRRIILYRTALLSAISTLVAEQHAVAANRRLTFEVYDNYNFTLSLPRSSFEPDGHHLMDHWRRMVTEALLRHSICPDRAPQLVPLMLPQVRLLMNTAFASTTIQANQGDLPLLPQNEAAAVRSFRNESRASFDWSSGYTCGCKRYDWQRVLPQSVPELSGPQLAAHPSCVSSKLLKMEARRAAIARHFAQFGFPGANMWQVRDLLVVLCRGGVRRAQKGATFAVGVETELKRCYANMGVEKDTVDWSPVPEPVVSVAAASRQPACLCLGNTTSSASSPRTSPATKLHCDRLFDLWRPVDAALSTLQGSADDSERTQLRNVILGGVCDGQGAASLVARAIEDGLVARL